VDFCEILGVGPDMFETGKRNWEFCGLSSTADSGDGGCTQHIPDKMTENI